MVLQHKENFATWDNITEFTDLTDTFIITNSNPCEWDDSLPNDTRQAGVKTSALPAVFSGSDVVTVYGRVKNTGMGVGGNARNGIFIFDDTTYVGISPVFDTQGFFKGVGAVASAVNKYTLATVDYAAKSYWTANQWLWLKIIITGTNVKYFTIDNNSTIKPDEADWIEATAIEQTLGGALGTITELGAMFMETVGSMNGAFVDDLEIVVGEGIPIDNAIVDGENVKLSSVYVRKTVGNPGTSARITYHDPLYTLGPTVETALRTVTTISETKFNTRMIQGEIANVDTMRREIIVNGVEAKLARTIANYNPVFMEGVVEYIDGNTMYKQDIGYEVSPGFSSFGTLTDKLVVFIKKRQKEYRCGLSSVDYTEADGTPDTPTATSGAIENTFFLTDRAFAQADRAYTFDPSGVDDRLILNFQGLIKDGSVINKATVTVKIRIPVKSQFRRTGQQRPRFMIKDFTAGIFRNFTGDVRGLSTGGEVRSTNGQGSEALSGELQSKVLELVVTIPDDIPAGVQADYFNVGAVNAHGFRQHDVTVGFSLGFHGIGQPLQFIMIESAELKFDLDIDQEYNIGVAKIQTVNDHNLVFYGNAAVSWLDADIRDDGISGGGITDDGAILGDAFFITDKISDIIEAFWVVSGMDLIMNISVTLTEEIPDIEDLRRVMILQYVQKLSELLGAIYLTSYTTDPVNDLPTFIITDSPVDTGQTWTDADFIEPMRQTTYKIDSSKELSTLKLIGKDGLIGTVSITPEHTPELGLETILISRPDIHTARQAASWLASKKKIYTSAYRYFSCRINYDRANQDYSIADIGKLVSIKNPADGSIVDHTAGSNGKLLIYQMELNRNWSNGYSNYMTFILQQRFFT